MLRKFVEVSGFVKVWAQASDCLLDGAEKSSSVRRGARETSGSRVAEEVEEEKEPRCATWDLRQAKRIAELLGWGGLRRVQVELWL